jgi:4-hydroxyphenylpyruvate dioxygenase
MDKSAMVDVIDPDGLVRSQALETPDRAFRITLNGAETHRTLAGAFLADSFGASVQHIALSTPDIFETASRLQKLGFDPLTIPENYYADLAARFDLDEARLAALKRSNILYDKDENGEFYQLYSRPYGGGVFFEIVDRRGGYAGYGAPNAPFRIAALKRLMRPDGMPSR